MLLRLIKTSPMTTMISMIMMLRLIKLIVIMIMLVLQSCAAYDLLDGWDYDDYAGYGAYDEYADPPALGPLGVWGQQPTAIANHKNRTPITKPRTPTYNPPTHKSTNADHATHPRLIS